MHIAAVGDDSEAACGVDVHGRAARPPQREVEFGQAAPQGLVERPQAERGDVVGAVPLQDLALDGDAAEVVRFGGAGGDVGAGVVDEVEDVLDLMRIEARQQPSPAGRDEQERAPARRPLRWTTRTISGRSPRSCPLTVVLICTLRPRSRASCQASRVQR